MTPEYLADVERRVIDAVSRDVDVSTSVPLSDTFALINEVKRLAAENAELRRVIAGEITRWGEQHQTDPEGPQP